MNITDKDQARRIWFDERPAERLNLITDIATLCYRQWDTWDIGVEPYGVQLAYLFATIANPGGGWSFTLDMSAPADSWPAPFAQALLEIFQLEHAIWLYIDREWNGLPEYSCPVRGHDCVGSYPIRHCYECSFDEAKHDFKTYKPATL